MQRNVFVIFAVLILFNLPSALLAQSFQHQLEYDFSKVTASSSSGTTAANALSYTYYFSEVQNPNLPLAEMEFGTRISSIGLAYSNRDTESRQLSTITIGGSNSELVSVFGEYKHEATGWFAGGSFSDGDTESGIHQDNRSYSLNVGKYLFQNTTLTLGYSNRESESENRSVLTPLASTFCGWQANGIHIACGPLVPFIPTTTVLSSKSEIETYRFSGRHLQQIAGFNFALGLYYKMLETTTTNNTLVLTTPISTLFSGIDTDSKSYGGDITGYLGKSFSAKLSYEKTENGLTIRDFQQFSLATEYFITSGYSVSFTYSRVKSDSIPPRPSLTLPAVIPNTNAVVTTYSQYRDYSPVEPFEVYTVSALDKELYSLNFRARF
jgi:hypothetical protein